MKLSDRTKASLLLRKSAAAKTGGVTAVVDAFAEGARHLEGAGHRNLAAAMRLAPYVAAGVGAKKGWDKYKEWKLRRELSKYSSMRKTAGFMEHFRAGYYSGGGSGFAGALGREIPTALAAAVVAGAGAAAVKGYNLIRQKIEKAMAYRDMLENNPHLQNYDAKHVHAAFNTLHKLAPDLASDPLVAGSFVHLVLEQPGPGGPMVSPTLARSLADLHSKLRDNSILSVMHEATLRAPSLPIRSFGLPESESQPNRGQNAHPNKGQNAQPNRGQNAQKDKK